MHTFLLFLLTLMSAGLTVLFVGFTAAAIEGGGWFVITFGVTATLTMSGLTLAAIYSIGEDYLG